MRRGHGCGEAPSWHRLVLALQTGRKITGQTRFHALGQWSRKLPPGLEGLAEFAFDLRWSAHHSAAALWRAVDPALWDATENPVLIAESVSRARLESLAADGDFKGALRAELEARARYLEAPTWMERAFDARKAGLCSVSAATLLFWIALGAEHERLQY